MAWLYAVLAAGVALAFRQGLVPPFVNPLPVIDVAERDTWLVDWRLASIKHYPSVCARTLKAPHIEAQQIADGPMKDGCGWSNAVRLVSAGGVHASFDKITCETAVALTLWLEHEVQPLALNIFGQRVTSVRSYGSYACRNIIGDPLWRYRRSEHAIANAADIA
ncbi:MAG: extensin family protein, partial [Hyphomicrobiaceae bacterium]|nr:extensin family protein [Hyphomicrobiaceae bacterium]